MERKGIKLNLFLMSIVGLFIAITLVMTPAAAFADGIDGTPNVQPSLKIQNIWVDGDLAYLGHPVTLKLIAVSSQELENVGMSFYLINKDDENNQFLLGSTLIPLLEPGKNEFQFNFHLPNNANYVGEYNIIGRIDPLDLRPELNGKDNVYFNNDYTILLSDEYIDKPDLAVVANKLDSETITLTDESNEALGATSASDFPDLCDGQIKSTLEVLSNGKTTTNVPISFCLKLPKGDCIPLMVWDSSQMAYVDYLVIPELPANIVVSIPVELLILPEQIPAIQNYLSKGQNRMAVKAEIDPFDQYEEYENSIPDLGLETNNNVKTVEVTVSPEGNSPFLTSGGLNFEAPYSKGFSNHWFGAKIEAKGQGTLDNNGAMALAKAEVPVTLAGNTFDFMKAELKAQATPQNMAASYFSIDVEFAGMNVYHEKKDGSYSRDWPWSVHKEKGYKEWITVGPIPVSLEAGASGELGFKVSLAVQKNFRASLAPYADIGAYAKAAVDIAVASAGVKGQLTLLKDTLNASTTCSMALKNDGKVLEGTLHENITNELDGPSGKISLFVQWTSIKWCKSCKCCCGHCACSPPYPCGTETHEEDKSLVHWDSFTRKETLLDKTQTADINLY